MPSNLHINVKAVARTIDIESDAQTAVTSQRFNSKKFKDSVVSDSDYYAPRSKNQIKKDRFRDMIQTERPTTTVKKLGASQYEAHKALVESTRRGKDAMSSNSIKYKTLASMQRKRREETEMI